MCIKIFLFAVCVTLVKCQESDSGSPLDSLRNSVPGEPGEDYPILAATQETSFSCEGLIFGGYYADPETECQQYNVCLQDPVDSDVLTHISFLCPNGTIFNQQLFNCDWWFNVDCAAATSLYGLAVGAFGTSGGVGEDVGTCPAPPPRGPGECEGAVSTCWSPGQRDTDCPNNGLCCFDGCADTCGEQPEFEEAALANPVEVTTPGYEYEEPKVTLPVRPSPSPSQPPAPVTTTGYKYEEPEITFPVRPSLPPAQPPIVTTPAALYGAPKRTGRRLRNRQNGRRNRRRTRKQGKRVPTSRPVIFV